VSAFTTGSPTDVQAQASRPRRPYLALGALALLVGVIATAGAWIYLGPRAVPSTYFTVTFPPGAQGYFAGQWNLVGNTREDVLGALQGERYTRIAGPFTTYVASDQEDQNGNSLRIGGFAALVAYLLFGLLGFSARFRRLETAIGDLGAAFGRRLGATKLAKAGSLLLVSAGVIASYVVSLALWWAFNAQAWSELQAGLLLALLAVVSMGIVVGIGVFVGRARISRGVGPFLVGYGGLVAVAWVVGVVFGGGAACVTNPVVSAGGEVLPLVCIADQVAVIISDGGAILERSLWTLFCAIPAIGALLVYRDYQRRGAARSDQQLTGATA
jgi:hypothetical protein